METPSNGGAEKRLSRHGRQIKTDAERLLADTRDAADDLARTLDVAGRVRRNPLAAVAIGFGVGYLLSGALLSRSTGRLLRIGVRLAVLPFIKRQLFDRVAEIVRGQEQARQTH